MKPLDYLAGLEFHGVKLGLDNIRRLLSEAGNPHSHYPAIHIGGTNGKGSVAAMVDAMARAAGYHVGRFTSPHLITLNERFTLNGECIPDGELEAVIARFQLIGEKMDPPPTYFELCTAVAFQWFADRKVDLAVAEVGMGGRFDATNVLSPIVSVITNVAMDHMEYLGDTIEKIAFEKAGIIKPGTPLVLSETRPETLKVLLDAAHERGSPAYVIQRDFTFATGNSHFTFHHNDEAIGPTTLALPGALQAENAATATMAAVLAGEALPQLDHPAIVRGLESARWPCRFERVLDTPPVYVDIAHNLAGARWLAAQAPRSIVVMTVSADKNAEGIVDALADKTERLIITQFEGRRALPATALSERLGLHPHEVRSNLRDAIAYGMSLATHDTPLLITGSIFGAGEARRILIEDYGAPPLRF